MNIKKIIVNLSLLILATASALSEAAGAGVLPVSIFNGRAVVMVGMDNHRKGCYTDFGGAIDRGELPYQAAAREFSEESLGLFNPNRKSIEQVLRNVKPIRNDKNYYMFPYSVPFIPASQFKNKMNDLIRRHGIAHVIRRLHAEKIDFEWVYITDLYTAIMNAFNNQVWVKSITGRSLFLYPFLTKGLRSPDGKNWLNFAVRLNIAQLQAQIRNVRAQAARKPVAPKAPKKPVAPIRKAPVRKPVAPKVPKKPVAPVKKAPVRKAVAAVGGINCVASKKIGSAMIHIGRGDVTKVSNVDAIVNAANEALAGGNGINGAVQKAAGPQLLAHCKNNIRAVRKGVRCPTGDARLTPAFSLSRLGIKRIIHAVGPRGNNPNKNQLLKDTYTNILSLASSKGLTSVVIPAISTGIFGFPIKEATKIALETTKEYLQNHPGSSLRSVYFALFSQGDLNIYLDRMNRI